MIDSDVILRKVSIAKYHTNLDYPIIIFNPTRNKISSNLMSKIYECFVFNSYSFPHWSILHILKVCDDAHGIN